MGKVIIRALEEAIVKILIVQPLMRGLSSMFGGGLGGGGGGLLGGLLGFDEGGYTGSGGKYQPAGIVHKGEYVMDAATTSRIGIANLDRLRGYANGGVVGAPQMPAGRAPQRDAQSGGGDTVNVPINIKVDATGADSTELRRTQMELAKLRAELPARVVSAYQDARKRRAL